MPLLVSASRLAIAAAAVLTLAGCRQDMHNQPKFYPQRGTSFFADGRSVRPQVLNTVARSQGERDSYFLNGLLNGAEADGMPIPVTLDLLARGQERYNVYCSPCHSRVGNGEGMIVQRGYYQAANFHSERLRQAPLGHFVNVIRNGYGAMPEYSAQVGPTDRWAITAYIRALQLSQMADRAQVAVGFNVAPLKDIAAQEGLPDSLAVSKWGLQPAKQVPILLPPVAKIESTPPAPIADAKLTPLPTPAAPGTALQPGALPKIGPMAKSTNLAEAKNPPIGSPAGAPASGAQAAPTAAKAKAAMAGGDGTAGAAIYTANCQMCHQATRQGMPPMIPSLVGIVDRVGKEHIREVVTNGIQGSHMAMPAFGERLSKADIENLIAHLATAPK